MEATNQNLVNLDVDSYNNLSMEQLKRGVLQIKEHSVISNNPLGCILTNYKYDKRPQVKIDNKKYYCSVIMKLYAEKIKYGEDYNIKPGFDCSHFYCHNQECVETDHLHFENHLVNKSRLCCRIYGIYKYDQVTKYICPHFPKCYICDYNSIKLN